MRAKPWVRVIHEPSPEGATERLLQDINKDLANFYWQNGYGAFSVSQPSIEAVIKYIHNQAEHHKKYNFKEELLRLLRAHKINFDETYLWS